MDPITIALGVMALIQGTAQVAGGFAGGKAAKAAGKTQAAVDLRVQQEKVRLLEEEERMLAGETRAIAVGSGVKADVGSPLTIIAEQARTFERERRFVKEVGAEKSELATRRAAIVGSQVRRLGFSQGASSVSNAFSIFAGG